AEDGIRARNVTGVQTCALPIWAGVFVVVIISGMNRPRTVPPHPALTLAKLSHELADLPRRTREREVVKVADELWLPSTADRDLGTRSVAYSRLHPAGGLTGWSAASFYGAAPDCRPRTA